VNSGWLGDIGDWVDGAFDTAKSVTEGWFDWKSRMTQYEAQRALANAEAQKVASLDAQTTAGAGNYGGVASSGLPDWVIPVGSIVVGGLILLMVVARR
jgi:hypothetical protein